MKVEKQQTNGVSDSINLQENLRKETQLDFIDSEELLKRTSAAPAQSFYQELVPIGNVSSHVESEENTISFFAKLFPKRIGNNDKRYDIEKELTRGGMGRILKGQDQKLRRPVVLKELLQQNSNLSRERFLREALITAKLEHPSIIPIHDMGNWENGTPYYAMKLIDGRSLHEVLSEKKTLEERLALLPHLIDACEAVAYAHENQIIHRDLKPQNILVGSFGETVVIDWGIAKDLQEIQSLPEVSAGPYRVSGKESELTEEGDILGTPAYMPLEQALGEEVDKGADVYALGAILYHLLSGKVPYQGKENREVLKILTQKAPVPLEQKVPSVPKDLLSIVKKAMAREPENRYSSAKELAEELKKFQAGQLVSSHSYSQKELLFRFSKRHLGMLILACIAVTILLVGSYMYSQNLQAAYLQETSARVLAEEQGQKADRSFALLLKEQGRQELLAGNMAQAAVLLSEAYERITTRGEEDKNLQLLLGNAMKPFNNWRLLAGQENPVLRTHFSEDGKEIITYHMDGVVNNWSAKSGALLSTMECARSTEEVKVIAWENEKVITSNVDNAINVWNSSTCDLLLHVPGKPKEFAIFFLSPDKTKLEIRNTIDYGRSPDVIEVWDINTGEMLFSETEDEEKNWYPFRFSPDRQKRVSIDRGGKILRVVNASDQKLIASMTPEETGLIFSDVWFSEDGTRLFLIKSNEAHDYDKLEIRDAASYQLLKTVFSKNQNEQIKTFSDNYDKFLTLKKTDITNKEAKIWSATTGKLITTLKLPPHNPFLVSSFKFFANGSRIMTVLNQDLFSKANISIWDVNTGEFLLSLEEPPDLSQYLLTPREFTLFPHYTISSDGSQVLGLSKEKVVIVWDLERKASTLSFESVSKPTPIKNFSLDGSKLITTSLDKTAIVWNAHTVKKLFTLKGHDHLIVSAEFSPDDQTILTASIDQTIKLWDANTGTLLTSFQEESPLLYATFSKDGSQILIMSSNERFQLRETNSGKLLQSFSANLSPVLAQLKTCSRSEQTKQSFSLPCLLRSMPPTTSTSNKLLFSLFDKFENTLLQTNAIVLWYLFFKDGEQNPGQFSPDGKYLAISNDKEVELWSTTPAQMLTTFAYKTDKEKKLSSIQFSPDGTKLLIKTSENGTYFSIQLYDIETNKELVSQDFNKTPPVIFSKNSQKLMTNTGQFSKIWDTNTGRLVRSVKNTETLLEKVIYSPNGEQFLSVGSAKDDLNLWDTQSGKKLLSLEVSSKVVDVKFSPDGNKLLLIYEEEPMQLWDLSPETRSPKEVSKIVKERIPWQLDEENGYLIPHSLELVSPRALL